ncbi:hypothetical protein F2P45_13670 [Massilia sp. CCM 8733]|uniref:Fe-S oxidoreductase n=1 Tax=Massilia mucilaginosa TaxID=2609282 RepID=A0ABX0NTE0_9BURK|nr:hypothetical protein [Massilia mucilaginosa]NHZ90055.1 hypothetical protein [Massilia mucilaginosa]
MQHREDQPPAYSRPSLLSTEQQEAAARASAQAREAAQAADSAALKADQDKRSKKGWLAGGAALLLVCAGVAGWMALDGGKPAEVTVAAAGTDAAIPEAAVVLKPAEPESDVSAAAILEHGAAPPAADKGKSLKDMLDAPRTAAEELDQLLASSPAETPLPKDASKAPARPAAREQKPVLAKEGAKKAVLVAKAAPAKPVAVKAAPAPAKAAPADDASLLAALVAHSKEGGAAKASNPGPAPTSLKQCKQLNAAQAEQCRVRLCAGSAKDDPQCRSLRVVKPEAD